MEKRATITTYDPRNGHELQKYPVHSPAEISDILRESRAEFQNWRATPLEARLAAIRRLAEILSREKESLKNLMQTEMGKSPAEGDAEVEKCVSCARYYAERAAGHLRAGPVSISTT